MYELHIFASLRKIRLIVLACSKLLDGDVLKSLEQLTWGSGAFII